MLSNLAFGGAFLKRAESKIFQIAVLVCYMFRNNLYTVCYFVTENCSRAFLQHVVTML